MLFPLHQVKGVLTESSTIFIAMLQVQDTVLLDRGSSSSAFAFHLAARVIISRQKSDSVTENTAVLCPCLSPSRLP